ncbi:MAG TPA: protein adenylyltransferase SelO family protein, partial [Planctomycetota bacterium]|nr:protein adenylyltransferase SelO family protein [Planctomycetota bacterium]
MAASHDRLVLEPHFTGQLRADAIEAPGTRQVRSAHFSRVAPTRVSAPELLAWTADLASSLGLPTDPSADPGLAALLAGQELFPGSAPYAMCYGGHQFGHWAGQLGDGRAINLGERRDANGVLQTLQLKGAGPTPYSRSADGWAVLRSSIREFLCSEAMFHLGVPTTRALSLVHTGDAVLRDMFYDGNARHEPGAVVCRVAPSFVRFGNFEIFAARNEVAPMRELADYVIREHFAHLLPASGTLSNSTYLAWFREVCERTAQMLVHWSRVGFVHGVMNTDNMSILGLTIDYGPYGWLEDYDPSWTPNTTDAGGRR